MKKPLLIALVLMMGSLNAQEPPWEPPAIEHDEDRCVHCARRRVAVLELDFVKDLASKGMLTSLPNISGSLKSRIAWLEEQSERLKAVRVEEYSVPQVSPSERVLSVDGVPVVGPSVEYRSPLPISPGTIRIVDPLDRPATMRDLNERVPLRFPSGRPSPFRW